MSSQDGMLCWSTAGSWIGRTSHRMNRTPTSQAILLPCHSGFTRTDDINTWRCFAGLDIMVSYPRLKEPGHTVTCHAYCALPRLVPGRALHQRIIPAKNSMDIYSGFGYHVAACSRLYANARVSTTTACRVYHVLPATSYLPEGHLLAGLSVDLACHLTVAPDIVLPPARARMRTLASRQRQPAT